MKARLILVFCFLYNAANGQDSTAIALDEILIYGAPYRNFVIGSRQKVIDSIDHNYPSYSIGEILEKTSGIFFKSYGSYMLSSISIRGTGAGHTSTLWHGLNINSVTLGQTDFSQIPSLSGESVTVHYGGASSLYGNEAIGGTILIRSKPDFDGINQLKFFQEAGSFGTFYTQAFYKVSVENFESKTKFYYTTSKNNFPFTNILKPGNPTERQQNAGVKMGGLMQDLYWKNPNGILSLHAWFHESTRYLQPTLANPSSNDIQDDQNLKIVANYKHTSPWGNITANIGYQWDNLIFYQSTITQQPSFTFSYQNDISKEMIFEIGTGVKFIQAESVNYSQRLNETRLNIYGRVSYLLSPKWKLSGNLRKESVSGYSIPLAASIGSEIKLHRSQNSEMLWKILGSTNYKIPTLNDRFWEPGGNPDLKSESGNSLESGISWIHTKGNMTMTSEVSLYFMDVNDWILWLPRGSIWSPLNIRNVNAFGIEIDHNGQIPFSAFQFKWLISYAYTRSINQTGTDRFDRSKGKQLPYVPIHNAALQLGFSKNGWTLGTDAQFSGERYITTDNESSLNPYWLIDMDITKVIKWHKHVLQGGFEIRNLFNTSYFTIPLRPNPGINFRTSLSILLNQI